MADLRCFLGKAWGVPGLHYCLKNFHRRAGVIRLGAVMAAPSGAAFFNSGSRRTFIFIASPGWKMVSRTTGALPPGENGIIAGWWRENTGTNEDSAVTCVTPLSSWRSSIAADQKNGLASLGNSGRPFIGKIRSTFVLSIAEIKAMIVHPTNSGRGEGDGLDRVDGRPMCGRHYRFFRSGYVRSRGAPERE